MKLDTDTFHLTQLECRIRNLINLRENRKKLNVFSCFCHSKYHKSITPPLQCDFFKMCTFSYSHLFLVSIFYHLASEKNKVHTGDLTHCKQTLQLIKFFLIKNMKGNRENWLAQFKFPFLSILYSFLLP